MEPQSVRTRPLRWLAALVALMLVAAACAADEPDEVAEPADPAEEPDDPDPDPEVDEEPADDFPTQEITFIVPLPAGSAPDVSFRLLSEIAEQELGQRIVIVNREGGAGTVGLGELAAAEADGYTIGMGAIAMVALLPELQDTTFDGPEDFEPIVNAVSATFVMFSPAGHGYGDLDGFVADARERPGELSVGIPGTFSIPHLQMELLRQEANIDFEMVPYAAGEQVVAVINETIDGAVAQPPIVLEHEADGTVEILGLISPQPDERFDIPRFTDFGYDVDVIPFEFVAGPRGIPQERVQILHDAYRAAFESDEFQEYLAGTALIADYLGPDELRQRLEEQTAFYRDSIEDFGWEPG